MDDISALKSKIQALEKENGELHSKYSRLMREFNQLYSQSITLDNKNNAQIKMTEKANERKSKFLAAMSHEIRTPMSAIIGISQIQLQNENLPDEYKTALMKILGSGKNLLAIINDILDISRIETGKLEISPAEYDTPGMISDAVQSNILRIEDKELEFVLDIDENLPLYLIGDELRLKQILSNLLSNAFKYTDKGFVKLSVGHEVENEDVILRFTVEDTGRGIKPEDVKSVFEMYRRFDEDRNIEGTGLGLSITKAYVEMMRGKIEVKSEYGKGSVFTVSIRQRSVGEKIIGAETAEQLRGFCYRCEHDLTIVRELMPYGSVLVVDDTETNLYVAEGLLSPYRLKVETVTSGFEAIERIESGNVYDIIFMDHMMPKMNGLETTQKIRSLGYNGVIAALTADAMAGNEEHFIKNGFDGFISKPIEIKRLNAFLNKYIRDRHPEEAKKYAAYAPISVSQAVKVTPKMKKVFLRDAEAAINTLHKTAENGDVELLATTVHAMKSALHSMGESSAFEMAFALEKAGLDGDFEYIHSNINAFIKLLESIINALTAELEETEPQDEDYDFDEDTAFLNEQLLIIKAACQNYDDEAVYSAIDILRKRKWKRNTLAAIEEIYDTLCYRSDFEAALYLINQLQNQK